MKVGVLWSRKGTDVREGYLQGYLMRVWEGRGVTNCGASREVRGEVGFWLGCVVMYGLCNRSSRGNIESDGGNSE